MGNDIPAKRQRELSLGWLMAVSDIIPFGQRFELYNIKLYLLGARTTGPRIELKGLESDKVSFKWILPRA